MLDKKRGAFALLLVAAGTAAAPPARADEPKPPRFPDSQHFTVDPIVDGLLILGGGTFDLLLGLILSTGEIKPQPPALDAKDKLLGIDKSALTQTIDENANHYSNIGLYFAYAYAVVDPIISGIRDGRRALLVDAVMYAESIVLTGFMTQITKIAVRRPRPVDYVLCADMPAAECETSTDLQLSFFSGHASATAAVSATATYLAFSRAGMRRPRPWITLGVGMALTAFVAYERVRSGEHFPTDVIMGSMAGAGIGVLVPHFHRRPHYHDKNLEEPPIFIGYAPAREGTGALTLTGFF
jgi:membrane-associated phospholipid phosphatase